MTEAELVKGCLRQDRNCQELLYQAYSRKMYGVCIRYMQDEHHAAEALQEAFIIVFNQLNNYRHEGSLEGWIRKIIITSCLKQIKKLKIQYNRFPALKENSDEVGFIDEDKLSHEEILQWINLLPEGYKMVFNMYVFDDMSHEEIANTLNISSSTSRTQLFKARKYLQKLYSEKNIIR